MAVYAATVTLILPTAKKLLGYPGIGAIFGSVNVTNYNQTLAEITGITGKFKGVSTVLLGGPSSLGYLLSWDPTGKALKAWYSNGTAAHTHDLLFIAGITATEPVAIAGGDTLGKNAATNRTIAGANSATKGGVVPNTLIAAGALIEVASDTNVGIVQFLAIGRI